MNMCTMTISMVMYVGETYLYIYAFGAEDFILECQ